MVDAGQKILEILRKASMKGFKMMWGCRPGASWLKKLGQQLLRPQHWSTQTSTIGGASWYAPRDFAFERQKHLEVPLRIS